jgi:hypothetical protein
VSSEELQATYRALREKERRGTFNRDDAVTLIMVCSELGKRGYRLNEDESDWIDDEPLTVLYLRFYGKQFRIKVWPETLGIERQPDGDNVFLNREEVPDADIAYEGRVWNFDALERLMKSYPFDSNEQA